jgi:hypothetical protein
VVPKLKGKVAITAVALAVFAGAGGTYAATKGSGGDQRQLFLDDVAKRLHVSSDQLDSAIAGALSDRLDAAVKAGRLTREQADAIEKHKKQEGGLPFLGPGIGIGPGKFAGPGPGRFPGPGKFLGGPPPPEAIMAGIETAAKYLGLTEAQLHEQMESGKSLAQLADDRNKPVDGLENAIKDAARSKLDAAVSDKRLSKAQEQQILDELNRHLDDIVRRKGAGPPPIDRRGGPHWDGSHAPPPGGVPFWGGRP